MASNLPARVEERFSVLAAPLEATIGGVIDALGGETLSQFDLPRIKLPAVGNRFWTIPSIDGPQAVPAFDAIIVHQGTTRTFWGAEFKHGVSASPVCRSLDGITGYANPERAQELGIDLAKIGGQCGVCPMAAFGSGKNGGAACSQKRQLFLLREHDILPLVLEVTGGSYQNIRTYMLALASAGIPPYAAITRFTIGERTYKNGNTGSVAVLEKVAILDGEARARTYAYAKALTDMLARSAPVGGEELSDAEF